MKIYSIQPNYSNSMGVRKNLNEGQTTGMPQPAAPASNPSFCGTKTRSAIAAAFAALVAIIPTKAEAAASGCDFGKIISVAKSIAQKGFDGAIEANARTYARKIMDTKSERQVAPLLDAFYAKIQSNIPARINSPFIGWLGVNEAKCTDKVPNLGAMVQFGLDKQNDAIDINGLTNEVLDALYASGSQKSKEAQVYQILKADAKRTYGSTLGIVNTEFRQKIN